MASQALFQYGPLADASEFLNGLRHRLFIMVGRQRQAPLRSKDRNSMLDRRRFSRSLRDQRQKRDGMLTRSEGIREGKWFLAEFLRQGDRQSCGGEVVVERLGAFGV